MRRCLLLFGFVVALSSATTSAAATPPQGKTAAASYTIRTHQGAVSRIGAWRISRDPTIRAAARVFGKPSSRTLKESYLCQVDWRRLRLRIYFANFGVTPRGQSTCSPSVGKAGSFTVRGRRFRTWEGLRVGHRSNTILDRHHSAEFRRGTWWLRTAVSPFGDEAEYPVVEALVADGRVRILRGRIGAAGE